MECREALAELDGYRTAELPVTVIQEIKTHLKDCTDCASELMDLKRLAKQVRGLRLSAPGEIGRTIMAVTGDQYGTVETDIGQVWVGFNDEGISMLRLGLESDAFERKFEERLGRRPYPGNVPEKYAHAIRAAAEGKKIKLPPISIRDLPPFEQEVLRHLARIPLGEVRPYAWLAKEAGRPKAVRAVGTVMARNPVPLLLPCHRVVPSTGGVGNYGFGPPMKRELLRREGVSPDDLDTWAKQRVRYIGSRTTGVYCFPTCRDARRIRWENRVPFANADEAGQHGYRPCAHCRPMTA